MLDHDHSVAVLRDRRFHHVARYLRELTGVDDAPERQSGSLLSAEGDEHRRLRKLCVPAFSQRAVDRLRPFMRETVERRVAGFLPSGRCELVADLCEPYPVEVICRLLGAPTEDWPLLARWATDLLALLSATDPASDAERVRAAQEEMTPWTTALIERRRRRPADDLLTALIQAEEEGDRLSTDELVVLVEAILVGGSDTTRNQLGTTVHLLVTTGRWAAVAADPSLVDQAVEECLRLAGTIRLTGRVAVEDVEVDGVRFPAGSVLLPVFAAANRDPAAFPQGDALDLGAERSWAHLSFGGGAHLCLGAWLARAELQEALAVLVRRLGDPAVEGEVTWRPPRSTFAGPTALPLRFAPLP